jgi:predicted nucleic acid-binding Zn ribbon protein
MTRRTGGTRGLRDVIGITLARNRLQGGLARARSIILWPQVVGPELAKLTRARTQQGNTLFVEVRDSSMAHFLTMQRATFLSMLQEQLGDLSVTELRFSVGRLNAHVPVPLPEPLPAPDRARARKLASSAPESLHDVALKAAEAVTRARRWREQQGYAPCEVCTEPSREQPCRACALTLEDPNVKRAALRLGRDSSLLKTLPEELGNSGTDAARHLALGALAEQMGVLAIECVRSGGEDHYREFLKQQATQYLKLHHRKSKLLRADWEALPEQALQVLKAGPSGI